MACETLLLVGGKGGSGMPKLTIIVPAYNVERFLDKCLTSICNQTYRDFEIILVNDGATDATPQLCQAWALRDARIRLINQENRGLAAVRNLGIREAQTSQIFFVDSDDYLELDAVEVIMATQERYDADVVIGGFVSEDLTGKPLETSQLPPETLLSGREALRSILYDRQLRNFAWMQLFRKDLFDGIFFPEGTLLEDFQTIYKVVARASRVAIHPRPFYHYVQQQESILNHGVTRSLAHITWLRAMGERCRYAQQSSLLSPQEKAFFYIYSVKRLLAEWKRYRGEIKRSGVFDEREKIYGHYAKICDEVLFRLCGVHITPVTYRFLRFSLFVKRFVVKLFYR